MMDSTKNFVRSLLLRSQQYTGTDNVYIARNSFWITTAFGITSLFSLILVIAFANLLPKETYGTYRYVMSLAGVFSFLTLSGMNTAVTQAVARGNDQVLPYSIKVQLRWNLLYALGIWITAAYYIFQGNNTIGLPLLALGAMFPINTTFNTFGAYLNGKKDFKTLSIYSVFGSLFSFAVMGGTLFVTHNIALIVGAYCIGTLGPTLYFYFQTIKKVPRSGIADQQKKELLHYGGHLSVVNIFAIVAQYIDKIVLFHFLGAVQVAVYGLALSLPERIRGYTKSIISVTLPKLSEKTMQEIVPVFHKRILQSIMMGALISALYITVAPFLFKVFLPKYLESIHYSQIFSLSFVFILPLTYMGNVFGSQKMVRVIYLSSVTANVLKIILFIVFGYLWGIWGVICASLTTYILSFFYYLGLWQVELVKYRKSAPPLSHAG